MPRAFLCLHVQCLSVCMRVCVYEYVVYLLLQCIRYPLSPCPQPFLLHIHRLTLALSSPPSLHHALSRSCVSVAYAASVAVTAGVAAIVVSLGVLYLFCSFGIFCAPIATTTTTTTRRLITADSQKKSHTHAHIHTKKNNENNNNNSNSSNNKTVLTFFFCRVSPSVLLYIYDVCDCVCTWLRVCVRV